jgi:hypothetical protein
MAFRCLPRCLLVAAVATASVLGTAPVAADPDAAVHGNYRGQCRRLTRQIEHYEERILPLAIERGNRAWERATNDQIDVLWHRRADLCPAYGAERSWLRRLDDRRRRFAKFLAQAGRATAAFFTGGVAP